MTKRGLYAKGVAARKRLLRAAAAAADPHGRLDLASLAGAAHLTPGGLLHHFPDRDAVLVAAAIELAADADTSADERLALTRELIRIACDRTSRAFEDASRGLRDVANSANGGATQHLGSLLFAVLHRGTGPRTSAVDQDGE